ncbi:MAG: DUF2931 family protein [Gammaproteobacteria bacterium]|nr:MAG: DUF2931 family protein [Gammaproteobacteria bacterium]
MPRPKNARCIPMPDLRTCFQLLLVTCLGIALTACATARDPNGYAYPADFKNYSVNVGVPFHYEVSIGSITTWWKDGRIAGGKPIGSRATGWVMGGTAGIMDGPIPDIVDFEYQALYEEKIYHVRFEITPHVKRVMYEKFYIRRPANGPLRPRYRRVISFGIMPGGRYVVWIESRRDDAIEVARGQAEFVETTPYYKEFREGRHGRAVQLNGLRPEWSPEHWTAYDNILKGDSTRQNRYPDNPEYWMPPKLEDLPPEAWKQGDMTPWRKRLPEVEVNPQMFIYKYSYWKQLEKKYPQERSGAQ